MVDGNEHEPTAQDDEDGRDTPSDGRSEKPISFDFKLRLGSRDSTAALTSRATGELVQLQPIDWDSFTGLKDDDEPRQYKTDGDLPSIIVELANQIAEPDSLAQRALRMNALANDGTDGADTEAEPAHRVTPVGPPPEIAVVTVEDDPMLSAVVGQILDVPREPVIETPPAPKPVSAMAPAVRAPADPAPEGPIEVPRIVALTPDLPSGEVAQSSDTPAFVPISPAPVVENVPTSAPVQMLTGPEAMQMMATPPSPPLPASPPAAPAPVVPLRLAKIERKPGAERPTKPVDFHALLGQAGLQPPPPKKRTKKRHPFRAMLKLIVVLAIIGGGLFFGKKYVLDMRWDAELKPYADAVAEQRELKWHKALTVETVPLEEYAQHLTTVALGPNVDEDALGAEWRAMGLLEGRLDLEKVSQYSSGFHPVLYDPTDHTIYELENLPDDLRDFYLYRAMASGLLDQHFDWSAGLDTLGRSARNARVALVEADASDTAFQIMRPSDREIDRINADGVELRDDIGVTIEGAIDYPSDLLVGPGPEAKNLFSEDVLPSVDDRNTMIDRSALSDAAVLDGLRRLSSRPDEVGVATNARGMVYWYYVLAGRMGGAEAWNAAVAWDGDETVFNSTPDGDCVSSTIATVDEPGRVRLLGALQTWAAAAPAEAKTTVAEVGTERISVTSCDPGSAADTKSHDGIQFWGMADVEYGLTSDLRLEGDDDARSCTINAIRNFGVLEKAEAGDADGAKAVMDQVNVSCADA